MHCKNLRIGQRAGRDQINGVTEKRFQAFFEPESSLSVGAWRALVKPPWVLKEPGGPDVRRPPPHWAL
jgi:hypothetical protein